MLFPRVHVAFMLLLNRCRPVLPPLAYLSVIVRTFAVGPFVWRSLLGQRAYLGASKDRTAERLLQASWLTMRDTNTAFAAAAADGLVVVVTVEAVAVAATASSPHPFCYSSPLRALLPSVLDDNRISDNAIRATATPIPTTTVADERVNDTRNSCTARRFVGQVSISRLLPFRPLNSNPME